MVSMTKLYDYLNWAFAFVIFLCLSILASSTILYFKLTDTIVDTSQFVQNSVDSSRQNIREDIVWLKSKIWSLDAQLTATQYSWTITNVQLQLVHYVVDVEICSSEYPSYQTRVDFYGINPRIENLWLLIIDKRYFASYEGSNVYLPILDENTGLDATICWLEIVSSK